MLYKAKIVSFSDIYKLEDGLGEKIPLFLNMQVTFISGFILCFVKGWKLALTALVPIPLIFVVNGLIHWVWFYFYWL